MMSDHGSQQKGGAYTYERERGGGGAREKEREGERDRAMYMYLDQLLSHLGEKLLYDLPCL